MGRLLILDSGLLIDVERGRIRPAELHEDDEDVAIAAVSAAELLTGVVLADENHRDRRRELVENLLGTFTVVDYNVAVARVHANLLAHVHRAGTPRRAHDLIIAATAAATGRILVTGDKQARFDDLPDVTVNIVGVGRG